jgi:hypothetical protein
LLTAAGFGCFVSSAITLLVSMPFLSPPFLFNAPFLQIFFPRNIEDSNEEEIQQQQQSQQQQATVSAKSMEDTFTFTQPFPEDAMAMYSADKIPLDVRPESDSEFSSFRFSQSSSPPALPVPQRPPRPDYENERREGGALAFADGARRMYPAQKPLRRDPSGRDVESWGADERVSRPISGGAPSARHEQTSSEGNLHPYVCLPFLPLFL